MYSNAEYWYLRNLSSHDDSVVTMLMGDAGLLCKPKPGRLDPAMAALSPPLTSRTPAPIATSNADTRSPIVLGQKQKSEEAWERPPNHESSSRAPEPHPDMIRPGFEETSVGSPMADQVDTHHRQAACGVVYGCYQATCTESCMVREMLGAAGPRLPSCPAGAFRAISLRASGGDAVDDDTSPEGLGTTSMMSDSCRPPSLRGILPCTHTCAPSYMHAHTHAHAHTRIDAWL